MTHARSEKTRSLKYSHTAFGRFLTGKHTNRSVSGSLALLIDNFTASITSYAEPLLAEQAGYVDSFYVSPAYLETYVDKFLRSLGRAKLGVAGLAVDDLGNLLVGDYRNRANISRVHATGTARRALDALAGSGGLVLNAPNDYALAHRDNRSGDVSRLCAYAGKYSAKDFGVIVHGILKGEK